MSTTAPEPRIAELGHVGIRCFDVLAQLRFYTEVLGLTVTDYDAGLGIYFLSARPEAEHHELLLASGRTVSVDGQLIQQVSFRCPTLADVIGFYHRLAAQHVTFDMTVSHGNAVGVYFFDLEGNRCEVYCQTGLTARQPFVEHIDLNQDIDTLIASIHESVARHGADGFTDPSYVRRTQQLGRPGQSTKTADGQVER
jgi:catechol-2,3-dioxygenase